MRKMITLNKILSDRAVRTMYNDSEEIGEGAEAAPVVVSTPVSVNIDAIRCFYARKENRPGTRITFTDGGGFAVTEAYEDVDTAVNSAQRTR